MKPEDRAACSVVAALLGRGSTLHRLALLFAAFALLASLGLAYASPAATAYAAAITALAVLASLGETYLAIRVAFDAELFRNLSTGALDLTTLDAGLRFFASVPVAKLGRPLEQRVAGAARLLRLQAYGVVLLAAIALVAIIAVLVFGIVPPFPAQARMIAALAAQLLGSLVTGLARLVTGVRPDWRGCLPEMRQRIYFANHGSHGDFVLIWTVLPKALRPLTRPVAGADYWDRPGLRGFVGRNVFNALMIDRHPEPGALHPVELMAKAIGEGSSLILFPEGTRNTTEEPLLPFRSGLYHLAKARPEVELVPVWIDNISRVMPKGEMLPIPLLCSVVLGAPLAVGDGEAKDAFLERARTALLELRPKEAQG